MFIKPALLKINDTVMVNLNNIVSVAVERSKQLKKIKPESMGKSQQDLKEEDMIVYSNDWMCFYTPTANGLPMEVGKDITQEEFDSIVNKLNGMELIVNVRENATEEDAQSS